MDGRPAGLGWGPRIPISRRFPGEPQAGLEPSLKRSTAASLGQLSPASVSSLFSASPADPWLRPPRNELCPQCRIHLQQSGHCGATERTLTWGGRVQGHQLSVGASAATPVLAGTCDPSPCACPHCLPTTLQPARHP